MSLDTVELEIPRNCEYSRLFVPLLERSFQPDLRGKIWSSGGTAYERRGDFRPLGLPVVLHQTARFKTIKGADKFQLIEAGDKRVSEWHEWLRAVYRFPTEEAVIKRLDMNADICGGVDVGWFRTHTRIAFKQHRRAWLVPRQEVGQLEAETIYDGKKPCQLRIYDKTRQRMKLLRAANYKRRKLGEAEKTFLEEYGYDSSVTVTRVERQMGRGEAGKVYGIKFLGEINHTVSIDPFERLVFPETARPNPDGMSALETGWALYIRDYCKQHGLANARMELKRMLPGSCRMFYRVWKNIEAFVHQGEVSSGCTHAELLSEYKASTLVQLDLARAA
jgi:hypothetical protein